MRKNAELRAEALRLRSSERLTNKELEQRLGVARSTLSNWLKHDPLSDLERSAKYQSGTLLAFSKGKRPAEVESKFHRMIHERTLSSAEKGRIAEAAVLFRLQLFGLRTLVPVFGGDRIDWLVETPSHRMIKLQVKWAARKSTMGRPVVSLTCWDGHDSRRRYHEKEFDILVGYDLFQDIAYVFTSAETAANLTYISVYEAAAERWDKILGM